MQSVTSELRQLPWEVGRGRAQQVGRGGELRELAGVVVGPGFGLCFCRMCGGVRYAQNNQPNEGSQCPKSNWRKTEELLGDGPKWLQVQTPMIHMRPGLESTAGGSNVAK